MLGENALFCCKVNDRGVLYIVCYRQMKSFRNTVMVVRSLWCVSLKKPLNRQRRRWLMQRFLLHFVSVYMLYYFQFSRVLQSVHSLIFQQKDLWCLGCWFTVTFSRSGLKVKIMSRSSQYSIAATDGMADRLKRRYEFKEFKERI